MEIQENFEAPNNPIPTPNQILWQQAEIGVLFHYDLSVFQEGKYNQQNNRVSSFPDINIFNPTDLNTDQWLECAAAMGAKFAIFTASHETGFRLWPSEVNDYSVKALKWGDEKRDIVDEFIQSCKKYGILPGIYLGIRWDAHLHVYDFKVTEKSPLSQSQYNRRIENEVEEICSRYGDLCEIWFDGGASGPDEGGPDILPIFNKYQKSCIFYHNHQRADVRWGGTESGTVSYPCWASFPVSYSHKCDPKFGQKEWMELLKHGDPDGRYWLPAMADVPLRTHEWVWNTKEENKIKSLKKLVKIYTKSVGRNSTLIIGLTPDNRGLVPQKDFTRCSQFGDKIKQIFNNSLGKTGGNGNTHRIEWSKSQRFDHIVIQEDIKFGERVRAYSISAYVRGRWKVVGKGSCIGHKHIHTFKAIKAQKIKLEIQRSILPPKILNFEIFSV